MSVQDMPKMAEMEPGTIYRSTVGNHERRGMMQGAIMRQYERAEAEGKLSDGYKKFLKSCFVAAGGDIDNDPLFTGD
jgi:hypothetical protein